MVYELLTQGQAFSLLLLTTGYQAFLGYQEMYQAKKRFVEELLSPKDVKPSLLECKCDDPFD